jgi:hypothetical protein
MSSKPTEAVYRPLSKFRPRGYDASSLSFVNHVALELLPLNWQPGDYQGHVNKAYGGCLQAAAQVPSEGL